MSRDGENHSRIRARPAKFKAGNRIGTVYSAGGGTSFVKNALLRSAFGHDAFRPGQEELIDALQSGRDLLGVMATGSGKSLCYQFPAVEQQKCCLVVSPLISLMNDQVKKLELAGIAAAGLHSHVAPAARQWALERWAA